MFEWRSDNQDGGEIWPYTFQLCHRTLQSAKGVLGEGGILWHLVVLPWSVQLIVGGSGPSRPCKPSWIQTHLWLVENPGPCSVETGCDSTGPRRSRGEPDGISAVRSLQRRTRFRRRKDSGCVCWLACGGNTCSRQIVTPHHTRPFPKHNHRQGPDTKRRISARALQLPAFVSCS
jgi:hypothetical protein